MSRIRPIAALRSAAVPCMSRRQPAARVAVAAVLSLCALAANAAEMRAPKGPIEITIGTSAGGTPDGFMRRVAKILNEEKIVENPLGAVNRVGGSWMVAANFVLNQIGSASCRERV